MTRAQSIKALPMTLSPTQNVLHQPPDTDPFATDSASRPSHFLRAVVVSLAAHSIVITIALAHLNDALIGLMGTARDSLGVELVSVAELDSLMLKSVPVAASPLGSDVTSQEAVSPVTDENAANRSAPSPDENRRSVIGLGDPVSQDRSETEARAIVPESSPLAAAPSPATDFAATFAAARASAGELSRFGLEVRTALGRYRPKHAGARGSVQVSFALDEVGQVYRVSVARSSGNNRLDELALDAIRQTQFPVPPAGTTDAQRIYIVPYIFK
jgi:TonB family protein